jgi:hypothetical protein
LTPQKRPLKSKRPRQPTTRYTPPETPNRVYYRARMSCLLPVPLLLAGALALVEGRDGPHLRPGAAHPPAASRIRRLDRLGAGARTVGVRAETEASATAVIIRVTDCPGPVLTAAPVTANRGATTIPALVTGLLGGLTAGRAATAATDSRPTTVTILRAAIATGATAARLRCAWIGDALGRLLLAARLVVAAHPA